MAPLVFSPRDASKWLETLYLVIVLKSRKYSVSSHFEASRGENTRGATVFCRMIQRDHAWYYSNASLTAAQSICVFQCGLAPLRVDKHVTCFQGSERGAVFREN